MKHRVVFGVLMATLALLFVSCKDVSALSYGSSTDIEFTFVPTLAISFSQNTGFIISDLSAGNATYSNTVTITVDSNASDGYILSATVGKTNDNYRNNNRLVHSNNTNYFEGIATNASVALSNIDSNKWGYATYDATNETWSNYSGLATVGNAGTTLITSTTPSTKSIDMRIGANTNINQVAGTFTNDINFTATARIVTYDYSITYAANNSSTVTDMPTNVTSASFNTGDTVQISSSTPSADNAISFLGWCDGTVSGTTCTGTLYQPGDNLKITNASSSSVNAVALTAIWELNRIYMQDMTDADCQINVGTGGNATGIGDNITVYDKRSTNYPSGDEGDYTARWINGQCWMTQNLRVQGTLVAADSNFTGNDFNVSAYDLKTNGGSGGACNSSNGGYSSACSHTPDSTDLSNIGSGATVKTVGRWYNYYATSAGTISGTSNSTTATSDVCPAGWKLPTGPNTTTNTDFNKLFGNTTSDWQNPTTGLSAFSAMPNGRFYDSSFAGGTNGLLWCANASDTTSRYFFYYNSTNGQFKSSGSSTRAIGYSIRCVLAS